MGEAPANQLRVVLGCMRRAISMYMHQRKLKGRVSLEQRCWEPQSHPQHRTHICGTCSVYTELVHQLHCFILNIPGFSFMYILHVNQPRLKVWWIFQGHTIIRSRDSNSKFHSFQSFHCHTAMNISHAQLDLWHHETLKETWNYFQTLESLKDDIPIKHWEMVSKNIYKCSM